MINNLDEAIKRCNKKAEELKNMGFDVNTRFNADTKKGRECYECAKDYEQVAEWLTELKERRERDHIYIHIGGYVLDIKTIEDYYPCDALGELDNEGTEYTFIKHRDGFGGIYFIDYEELFSLMEDMKENKNE